MKTSKGLTLIEVMAVVGILAIATLMPSLGRSRHLANEVKCSTQLNGIGKALALYQNDYRESYPVVWGDDVRKDARFGMGLYNAPGEDTYTRWMDSKFKNWNQEPTVGGCLWLLIKYEDLVPNMFLCPQDDMALEMDLETALNKQVEKGWTTLENWADLNDFYTMANLSYAYNDPWTALLDASVSSYMVVMADKSCAYYTVTGAVNPAAGEHPVPNSDGTWIAAGDNFRAGNSPNHHFKNQNVLFADSHVQKYDTPLQGIQDDNIYTHWDIPDRDKSDKRIGFWNQGHAQDMMDSYLGN